MQLKPTLVILAAGAGSRYGGLKQLAPLGPSGETLLEYAAYDASRAGFGSVVLVTRPELEAHFRERLADGMARTLEVSYAHQTIEPRHSNTRTKPWGTAHAVLTARPFVDAPFATLNADDFYGAIAYARLAEFLTTSAHLADGHLAAVGFEVGRTLSDSGPVSRALCRTDGYGSLTRIVELERVERRNGGVFYDDQGTDRPLRNDQLVSMNMWGFTPSFFDWLEGGFDAFLADAADDPKSEFRLPDVVQFAIDLGQCRGQLLEAPGPWCGLTYESDHATTSAAIAALVESGSYPANLWS